MPQWTRTSLRWTAPVTTARAAILLCACAAVSAGHAAPPTTEPPARAPATAPAKPAPATPAAPASNSSSRAWSDSAGVLFTGWTLTRTSASRADDPVAVILGKLLYSKFTLDCTGTPAAEVLRAVTRALDVNSAVRYDGVFSGQAPVTLALKDATGKQVIEAVIGQMRGDGTWQITEDMLEIGRRPYLARTNARVTRVYPIGDLTFEAPYFQAGVDADAAGTRRKPIDVAGEFMFQIYTQLEPAVWQPEPPPEEAPEDPNAQPGKSGPATPPARPTTPPTPPAGDTTKPANFNSKEGPLFVRGCWAQMSYRPSGGVLVVTAPDFVHRAINGYPKPLPPVGESGTAK